MEKQKTYKLLLLGLALLLACAAAFYGFTLWQENRALRQAEALFMDALHEADLQNAAITFSVPYKSDLFTPQNISQGQMEDENAAILQKLTNSLIFAEEVRGQGSSENIAVLLPVSGGTLTLYVNDADRCILALEQEGEVRFAACTYDLDARDALLAVGGLPTIAEMKEAIENDLKNHIETFGDGALDGNTLK